MSSQDSTIRSRLDLLKQQSWALCDGDVERGSKVERMTEFLSSIQLWKERSLNQVLEALDKAGVQSIDSHIEAMEHHEKAALHLFELTRGLLHSILHGINLLVDDSVDDLEALVDCIVSCRLEKQQQVYDDLVKGLKSENHELATTCRHLQSTKLSLEGRLELLENSSGAGDAILCDKLRGRIQHLVIRQRELSTELESAARERVKHRRELEKAKTQQAESQRSLALTRAMHDKETSQLAAIINLNHSQVAQILDASKNATDSKHYQESLERFDPMSGCTIVHLAPVSPPQKPPNSPSSTSHRRSISPVLTASLVQKKQGPPATKPRQRAERPKSATTRSARPTFSARHQHLYASELHKTRKWCNS
ncbi:hypothetical protein GN244_ATG17270 [Phytophthora infestans]|uniref:Uncharacterized protein n=1 Tax=Phytophthora infestans TaxID=4787 RepID=A0A833W6Q7_PHYIN|nr:hypothetical protein GN244_ATG17270 [Phytophthora infestans]